MLDTIKDKINDNKAKVGAAVAAATTGAGALLASPAFADDSTSVASQMGTLATTVQTDATNTIMAVLPAVLGVLGVGIVVGIGIKWVRKMRQS